MSNVNGRTKDTFDLTAVVSKTDTPAQVNDLLSNLAAAVLGKAMPVIFERDGDRWVTITVESAGHLR